MNKQLDTNLTGSITIEKQTGTQIVFDTDAKYIPKDITLNVSVQQGALTFTKGSINETEATITSSSNVVTSTNDNQSGASITCGGAAGCSSAQYTNTAGWIAAQNSATNAGGAVSKTTWNGTSYFINGVNIENSKNFNITVPNGASTMTLNFAVDASGNVVVT